MIQLKQVAGVLGLLVAVVGIALGNRAVIWVAMGLLGGSILLRIAIAAKARRDGSDAE